jgi:hypothetical protein
LRADPVEVVIKRLIDEYQSELENWDYGYWILVLTSIKRPE